MYASELRTDGVPKTSTLQNSIDRLHTSLSDVEHLVYELEGRLSPVLTEPSPKEPGNDQAMPARHVGAVLVADDRVQQIGKTLSHILQNLEV